MVRSVHPFLLIGISTANRAPRPNYVGTTLRALAAQGVPADQVHVFATDPDVAWLHTEAAGAAYALHVPDRQLTRNENGIALLTEIPRCEWVLHLEDDLAICRDFVPSVVAWLEAHARPDRRGYFFHTPWCDRTRVQGSAWDYPIRRSNWIQAVALRHQDAEDFARWAQARLATWRRSRPPRWRFSGFDELLNGRTTRCGARTVRKAVLPLAAFPCSSFLVRDQ